ncbi:hypothetical protein GGC63_006150, partial [Paenibacillus sp. OAS669]|nr:hypothetical protein [Paenibacillus sp. OAS669]
MGRIYVESLMVTASVAYYPNKTAFRLSGVVFYFGRAQLSTHLLSGESPVAGGAKPPRSLDSYVWR